MKKLSSERGSLAGDFYFIQINKAEYIENLISAFAEVGIIESLSHWGYFKLSSVNFSPDSRKIILLHTAAISLLNFD